MIERYFRLRENQTTVRSEFLGGVTTFLTMAYIVVVNPQILGQAGMPVEGVLFATCIAAAIATLVMGLYANYPIALAPGMSLNAYFTYVVCLGMHVPWRTALGVIFFSGVAFLILTVTRVREQIVNGIPGCLKHSDGRRHRDVYRLCGIAQREIGGGESGDFCGPGDVRESRGTAGVHRVGDHAGPHDAQDHRGNSDWDPGDNFVGNCARHCFLPGAIFSLPHPSLTWLQLDLRGALRLGLFEIVFVFLFVDLFDNVGTLVGVCGAGRICKGWEDSAGRPRTCVGRHGDDRGRTDGNVDRDQLH